MEFVQVYIPNILVRAIQAFCLKYIDDAGNAPNRTATARYSWEVERNAGRIKNETLPDNVWVVGWLDFTAGQYTSYGHVFFIKRNGDSILIYDSEVQSGARNPYKSINELLAWFGAYKPVFTGWSTHCDGREYAKLKENEVKPTDAQIDATVSYLHWATFGKAPSDPVFKSWRGLLKNNYVDGLQTIFRADDTSPEALKNKPSGGSVYEKIEVYRKVS